MFHQVKIFNSINHKYLSLNRTKIYFINMITSSFDQSWFGRFKKRIRKKIFKRWIKSKWIIFVGKILIHKIILSKKQKQGYSVHSKPIMLSLLNGTEEDSEENENYTEMSKHGQWIRRRRLDGSLNSVWIQKNSKISPKIKIKESF